MSVRPCGSFIEAATTSETHVVQVAIRPRLGGRGLVSAQAGAAHLPEGRRPRRGAMTRSCLSGSLETVLRQ